MTFARGLASCALFLAVWIALGMGAASCAREAERLSDTEVGAFLCAQFGGLRELEVRDGWLWAVCNELDTHATIRELSDAQSQYMWQHLDPIPDIDAPVWGVPSQPNAWYGGNSNCVCPEPSTEWACFGSGDPPFCNVESGSSTTAPPSRPLVTWYTPPDPWLGHEDCRDSDDCMLWYGHERWDGVERDPWGSQDREL